MATSLAAVFRLSLAFLRLKAELFIDVMSLIVVHSNRKGDFVSKNEKNTKDVVLYLLNSNVGLESLIQIVDPSYKLTIVLKTECKIYVEMIYPLNFVLL